MPSEKVIPVILTVSSILFGFLFAGFWWFLNREVSFPTTDRHFKPSTGLLLSSMLLLVVFGIILPLHSISRPDPLMLICFRGLVLTFIGVFGYMLTEMGHYSMFQRPKYTTKLEWIFCLTALFLTVGLVVKWCFF